MFIPNETPNAVAELESTRSRLHDLHTLLMVAGAAFVAGAFGLALAVPQDAWDMAWRFRFPGG